MSNIYLASSWRNGYQQQVLHELRHAGHVVYDFKNPGPGKKGFDWADIDKEWHNWTVDEYTAALRHPIAKQGFQNDFEAMGVCDTCVMLLPCGRSANAEAGFMKGAGKTVYVLQPIKQEPELMYKMFDGIFDSTFNLLQRLGTYRTLNLDNDNGR